MTHYYPLRPNTRALFKVDVNRMKNEIIAILKTYDTGLYGIIFSCRTYIHFWYPTIDDISVTFSVRCHASHFALHPDLINILSCRNYYIADKTHLFTEHKVEVRDEIMDITFTFHSNKGEYEQFGTDE